MADEQDRRERERPRYVLRCGAWRRLLDVDKLLGHMREALEPNAAPLTGR